MAKIACQKGKGSLFMEQYGRILENHDKTALVSLQRHQACSSCGRCGIISGSGKKEVLVEALNPLQIKAGRRVVVESDDGHILLISFVLYLVPLAALLGGIFAWLSLAPGMGLGGDEEIQAVLAGLAMMALVFGFIRLWDRRVKNNPRYKPVITADCPEEQ